MKGTTANTTLQCKEEGKKSQARPARQLIEDLRDSQIDMWRELDDHEAWT